MNVITILCDTLRRDHVGAYSGGRPLDQCWSAEAPAWSVPTPNMDRLIERGTVFDNAYIGSTPCMPARRDIYTGRLEFLERGWGPLEEEDRDLPRQVSGPPNRSIQWSVEQGYPISCLLTDHFHLWEQGSGNYHMGYTGFEFVRGIESDALYTDPIDFHCPPGDRMGKNERHWRNVHFIRQRDEDYFCAQVCTKAADWLRRNSTHEDFYLHLDIFDPHEPWDPPEEILKQFDPRGYDIEGLRAAAPYAPWRDHYSEAQFQNMRARYAAKVFFLDQWLGKVFDALDALDLWKDTLVVLTTDHGTWNGDHGRMGKLGTHQYDGCAHIPLIMCHPEAGHGQRRDQLVQLMDLYPTVLSAVGRPLPEMPDERPLHGIDLLPVLENADAPTRSCALMGMFGKSVTVTDGDWTLHQSPVDDNEPLYWHGYHLARFIKYDLGSFDAGRRPVSNCSSWDAPTSLHDKRSDPNELVNLAEREGDMLGSMQDKLRAELVRLRAPAWQVERLGL
ncbi:MAG: sulfatase [Candidatus Latescibacterota bacterium]|nr:sulfatase [Candidatus Latescibacterota bacterium]